MFFCQIHTVHQRRRDVRNELETIDSEPAWLISSVIGCLKQIS